jgi:pimeloyl-ACP methyl ester carboxylesterase
VNTQGSALPGTLVFSHANGFPAGTYRVLFEAWRAAGWRVEAVERFGHDAHFPVSSNWPKLRDELIQAIEGWGCGPAVLVGHSLGGLLSLMAACKRPRLASGLVLLDAPLIAGWRAHSLHVMKAAGLLQRGGPGKVARRRRQAWPSTEAAHAHYAAKAKFARWDPRVLADYAHAGTEPDPAGGVRLAFDRRIEASIYDTLPHRLPDMLRRHPLRCPAAFIVGTQSQELRQAGLAATKALVHGRLQMIEGTHLFPMERPDETAAAVLGWLPTLTNTNTNTNATTNATDPAKAETDPSI